MRKSFVLVCAFCDYLLVYNFCKHSFAFVRFLCACAYIHLLWTCLEILGTYPKNHRVFAIFIFNLAWRQLRRSSEGAGATRLGRLASGRSYHRISKNVVVRVASRGRQFSYDRDVRIGGGVAQCTIKLPLISLRGL